jgi:hypothetical protein
MRVIGPSSEEEMIAVFLRGELASDRFGGAIREALARAGAQDDVVTMPDLGDEAENAVRRLLLTETRAYGTRDGVFSGFPDDVRWQRVVLARDELVAVRYIDWDYWLELSGGSRSPVESARRIRAGFAPYGISTDGFLVAAERVGERWPALIVCTSGEEQPLVLLEGHVRLTAYALAGGAAPDEVAALLGTSPRMSDWALY